MSWNQTLSARRRSEAVLAAPFGSFWDQYANAYANQDSVLRVRYYAKMRIAIPAVLTATPANAHKMSVT